MPKSKKRIKSKVKNKVSRKAGCKVRLDRVERAQTRPKLKRMPKKELKKFMGLLIKLRSQVGGDLSHITENMLNKSARDASGDLSGYSYHMADMASDDYERDFSLGRATDEQKILYSIDEAMKRVEDGTYGSCLQCGKSVSKKRLVAMPQTELCIDCQKKNEEK